MKKQIMTLSILLLLAFMIVGCDEEALMAESNDYNNYGKIELLYEDNTMSVYDFVDPETGVHYLIYRDDENNNGGITVRYKGRNIYKTRNDLYVD